MFLNRFGEEKQLSSGLDKIERIFRLEIVFPLTLSTSIATEVFFIVTFLHFSFHVVSWSDVDNENISRIMNYWSYITVAFYIYKKTKLDWNRNMEQIGQVRMCKLKIDIVKNSNQTDVN